MFQSMQFLFLPVYVYVYMFWKNICLTYFKETQYAIYANVHALKTLFALNIVAIWTAFLYLHVHSLEWIWKKIV